MGRDVTTDARPVEVGLCWSRVVTSDVIQVVVVPKRLLDTLHGSTQSAYCIAIRDH